MALEMSERNSKPKAVVLLSGGLDSMVCAGLAREAGFEVLALTIDYNQRHRVELEAARQGWLDLVRKKAQTVAKLQARPRSRIPPSGW